MSNYMKTYTGKKIEPLNPKAEDIDLRDIAHALSLLCRGNGQTIRFYSVGQHCINCAKEAAARNHGVRIQLLALLHDASEAYLNDVIRPVKQHLPLYKEMEDKLLDVIMKHFFADEISLAEWETVKTIDNDILVYDLVNLLNEEIPEEGFSCVLIPDQSLRTFEEVEEEYFSLACELLEQIKKIEK